MTRQQICKAGQLEIGRRGALLGLGASLAVGKARVAFGASSGAANSAAPLFVVINIRGGLDGLSLAAPYGDPNLANLRGQIMSPPVGQKGGMLPLDGFFGLHPAMPQLHAMYTAKQALFVHAVGNIAYTRSHFEGQDYLQGGAAQLLTTGWLDRVLGMMPGRGGIMPAGLSMAVATPLLVAGPTQVAGWSADPLPKMNNQFVADLTTLLQGDSLLGPVYSVALADRSVWDGVLGSAFRGSLSGRLQTLCWAAGKVMATPTGPTIATVQTDSLDTHSDQVSRLHQGLGELDGALAALKTGLGAAWANTVVMTITEFGRTAYANGGPKCGTDHGTGFCVILAGGAVAGGRVVADWPGLGASQLYQGRDLAPTTDVRAIAMAVLEQHVGLPPSAMQTIFPGNTVAPLGGLLL